MLNAQSGRHSRPYRRGDAGLFWPDLPDDHTSAFVHRLVVKRRYKGHGISIALLRWAVEHARALGRSHLRLDCDKSRPKLMALYEGVGFQFHSFRQVGPYAFDTDEPMLGRPPAGDVE